MTQRLLPMAILLGACASLRGQTAPASRPGAEGPFETMERLYKPLTADEIGWAMKVDAVSSSAEKFARGTRELFYLWARDACADWARDPASLTWCHGDVHLGNEGVYVADIATAKLALGLTDFDEAYVGPFQMDLLSAVASLRLGARQQGLELTPQRAAQVARDVCEGYRKALASRRNATEEYGEDPRVRDLLVASDKTVRDESEKHTSAGKYLRAPRSKKGELRDILEPFPNGVFVASVGLNEATQHSAALARLAAPQGTEAWGKAIEDVVLRRHLGSGGSQGMIKIFARTRGGIKLGGSTSDAAFYLKAQGPSAAERAGFAPVRIPDGGERVAEGAAAMCSPARDGFGWCDMSGIGFTVEIRVPWDGAVATPLTTSDDLAWASRYLGYLVGAAHASAAGSPERSTELASKVTAALASQIDARATTFIAANRAAFELWNKDPRVDELRKKAQAYVRDVATK